MEKNNNHIIYSAEDIKRYLSGGMQPLEMNALEKAALDDPFLAEAIEGYEIMQGEDWQKPLAHLKQQFAAEAAAPKVVSISRRRNNWMKYAAVLLLGAATATYFLVNNKNTESLSKEIASIPADTKKDIPANLPVTDDSLRSNSPVADQLIAANREKEKTPKPIIAQQNIGTLGVDDRSNPIVDKDLLYKKNESSNQNNDLSTNTAELAKESRSDSAAILAEAKSSQSNADIGQIKPAAPLLKQQNANAENVVSAAGLAKKKERAEETNRTFIAQVVGPDNNPLPFANINVTNQGFGTYADVKGNVRLVSTDSLIPVEVKSLGYVTQNIVLRSNNNQPNKIVLKEAALTVSDNVDYAKVDSRKNKFLKYNPVQDTSNAEPADGWDNYNTYVLNNIEIPDEVVTKNLHGEVEVSFDVKRNGTITNVKVNKSLCTDCDEIAKRLVEQGPQWKVKKGRKAKGKIKVQF